MQYYLELEPAMPDAYFESGAFPKASKQLEAIAKRLGLPSQFEFFSYAAQDDLCPPEYRQKTVPWFEPQAGIDWVDAVSTHVRADPAFVPDAGRLLDDLANCADVLRRAKANGSKWHFAMDV